MTSHDTNGNVRKVWLSQVHLGSTPPPRLAADEPGGPPVGIITVGSV
jgi:hypothetical protein